VVVFHNKLVMVEEKNISKNNLVVKLIKMGMDNQLRYLQQLHLVNHLQTQLNLSMTIILMNKFYQKVYYLHHYLRLEIQVH
jgi:hypothetical protein